MKKAVVLSVVLLLALSSRVHAEKLDCLSSFELGRSEARMQHRLFWKWYAFGIGWAVLGGALYGTYAPDPAIQLGGPLGIHIDAIPLLVNAAILAAPFVPAFFMFPNQNRIFPSGEEDEVQLECYRDGYRSKARLKQSIALLLGEATVVCGFLLITIIIVGGPQYPG